MVDRVENQGINTITIGTIHEKFTPPPAMRRRLVPDFGGSCVFKLMPPLRIIRKPVERFSADSTPLVIGQHAWRLSNDSRPHNTVVKCKNVLHWNVQRPFDHLARSFSKIRLAGVTPNDLVGPEPRFEFRIRHHDLQIVAIAG